MKAKLTIRIDVALIGKAKAWATLRGVSVSEMVADFLVQLPDPEQQATPQLSAWTDELTGLVRPDFEAVESGYLGYLETKYR